METTGVFIDSAGIPRVIDGAGRLFTGTGLQTVKLDRATYYIENGAAKENGVIQYPVDDAFFVFNINNFIVDTENYQLIGKETKRVKLIEYALSLLHTSYSSVDGFTCGSFVREVYRTAVNIELYADQDDGTLNKDIIKTIYVLIPMKCFVRDVTDVTTWKTGDILFWNMDECDQKAYPGRYDNTGAHPSGTWKIGPADEPCKRIHLDVENYGGIFYHTHHNSIYLGNGQVIDCTGQSNVAIRNMYSSSCYLASAVGLLDET